MIQEIPTNGDFYPRKTLLLKPFGYIFLSIISEISMMVIFHPKDSCNHTPPNTAPCGDCRFVAFATCTRTPATYARVGVVGRFAARFQAVSVT
jgi:hypothetical protein